MNVQLLRLLLIAVQRVQSSANTNCIQMDRLWCEIWFSIGYYESIVFISFDEMHIGLGGSVSCLPVCKRAN